MSQFRLLLVAALSGSVLVLGACKDDEFAGAPAAKAPPATAGAAIPAPGADQPASAPAAGAQQGGSAGPLAEGQGGSLPANHPPIGQIPGAAMPQGMNAAPAGGQHVRPSDVSEYGKVGPIRWTAPESWIAVNPANEMRLAQYNVPGDEGAGELTVFYFGPGGGGGVDANLERWAGQFTGGPEPVRATRTIGAFTVHTVDASGKFDPGMAMGAQPGDNQRVLGAIAETAAGLYFFKLVGPIATVTANEASFEAFLASFTPGE